MTVEISGQPPIAPVQLPATHFFVAGGTLHRDSTSYVKRPADDDLFNLVLAGNFCYLLTARQMGKSSLMVRTARRLEEAGVRTAIIDLTKIGAGVSAEQWYLGLLRHLKTQLSLATDPQEWWASHTTMSPVQRFINFLHDAILAKIEAPVAIFIDEIDSTLSLPFSDDFFAAVRSIYNARATDPTYERLTFVLLGVATPSDLMKDRSRTPFNVGRAIDLREFSRQDAQVLQDGLQRLYPEGAAVIFDRIYYWTNGHPYLTQKLCLAVAERNRDHGDPGKIDQLVEKLFFSEAARGETNLHFIRDKITVHPQKRSLLALYRQVHGGKQIVEDERSVPQNQLKLFGLVRAEKGLLQIRNRIYRQVFNQAWIKSVMPVNWTRRIAAVSVMAVVFLSAVFFSSYRQQEQRADEALAQRAIDTFNTQRSAALRLDSLSQLFSLDGYSDEARTLFIDGLGTAEKLTLFSSATDDLPEQRQRVVQGVYLKLDDTDPNNDLLGAMREVLRENPSNQAISAEIEQWLNGRDAYRRERFGEAIKAYGDALAQNKQNPAVYFDRGLAFLALEDYEAALADFGDALTLDLDEDVFTFWRDRVSDVIVRDANLHARWWQQQNEYSVLAFVPTPTPTPTPTSTPTSTATPDPTFTPAAATTMTTATRRPTATRTPTRTPTATRRPVTPTSSATATATVSEATILSTTAAPTATSTAVSSRTPSPTPTPTPVTLPPPVQNTPTSTATPVIIIEAQPPVFSSSPPDRAIQGTYYSYDVMVSDPDVDDILTITAPVKPDWLALTDYGDGIVVLEGIPDYRDVRLHPVTLQVQDSYGFTDTQTFTISVGVAAAHGFPITFDDITIHGVNIQGQGQVAYVAPGASVSVEVTYFIRDPGCPGCIDQILIGIANDSTINTPQGCVYNGIPGAEGVSGSGTITFAVPSEPGAYAIRFRLGQDYSCQLGWWSVGFTPGADRDIGIIVVEA